MMVDKPDAFLSYTRFDDKRGKISEFRNELSYAIEAVSGTSFEIFQDVDDEDGVALGQKWRDVLDEMLDRARFFIPILTPKFFNSQPCRDELGKFLELERKTGRQDLVLPIYWITCPVLEEGHLRADDELAQAIDERQHWDWRKLRHRSFASPEVAIQLEALGAQIERARRNVLRVIEISAEAIVEPRIRSDPPTLKVVELVSGQANGPPAELNESNTFDRVQMRGVRREKVQPDPAIRSFQPRSQHLGPRQGFAPNPHTAQAMAAGCLIFQR